MVSPGGNWLNFHGRIHGTHFVDFYQIFEYGKIEINDLIGWF